MIFCKFYRFTFTLPTNCSQLFYLTPHNVTSATMDIENFVIVIFVPVHACSSMCVCVCVCVSVCACWCVSAYVCSVRIT